MGTANIQNPRSKWAGGVAEWREAVRNKNNYHLIMGPMSFSHPSLALQPDAWVLNSPMHVKHLAH